MSWIDKLKDLHDRVTAARAGKLDYLQNLEDGVYFDSVLGSAGTDWPKATAQDPSSVIASVITICAARKTKVIYGSGSVALGATMEGYTFIGINQGWTIDLNGQDVDTSYFYNCTVTGVQGGTGYIHLYECIIEAITGYAAYTYNCEYSNNGTAVTPRSNTISYAVNPRAISAYNTLSGALISFAGADTSKLYFIGAFGFFDVFNMTNANCVFEIIGSAAIVYSEASNTAGAILAWLNTRLIKGSGGATESDNSIYARIGDPAGASVSADIAALKAVADAIPTTAMRGTDNALLASEGETTTLNAGDGTVTNASRLGKLVRWIADAINNGTYGLSALQTLLAAIPTTAMRGTDNAALASEWTSTRAGYVDNLSGGAVALASNCDAKSSDIKTKTDKIALPVYRQIFKSADSAMLASLAFSNVAADKDFPSVVATAKPTGATITKAYWGFSYSKKVDSSAGANAVNAANKTVRVKVSTGAWGTDDIVAFTFANGTLSTPASATEGGMMIMGSVDIKSVVDGSAATFNFRSEETERSDALTVTGASLTFYDVESLLIVEYTL